MSNFTVQISDLLYKVEKSMSNNSVNITLPYINNMISKECATTNNEAEVSLRSLRRILTFVFEQIQKDDLFSVESYVLKFL